MTVAERIKEKMAQRKISQNKLAKLANMSQSGLSSIVNGAVCPKQDTLCQIAEALGCTVSELIGETEQQVTGDPLTRDERQLVDDYRRLNKMGREYIRQTMVMALAAYAGESPAVSDLEAAR